MNLSEQEKSFIEKRKKFARYWPWAGTIMILVLAAFVAWLFWSRPLLVNPWLVLSQLKAEAVPDTTLILMSAMLPVSMLMCFVIVIFFIMSGFSVFSKERKYISIITRLITNQKNH